MFVNRSPPFPTVYSHFLAAKYYDNYAQCNGESVRYRAGTGVPFEPMLFPVASTVPEYYVDANGIAKPHYHLLQVQSNLVEPCLSFIRDTQWQRANLLASQLWKTNQSLPPINLNQ